MDAAAKASIVFPNHSTTLRHWCLGCPWHHSFTTIVMYKVRCVQMMDMQFRALAYQTLQGLKSPLLGGKFPAFPACRTQRDPNIGLTKGKHPLFLQDLGAWFNFMRPFCSLHPSWGLSAHGLNWWSSLSSPHPCNEESHEKGISNQKLWESPWYLGHTTA